MSFFDDFRSEDFEPGQKWPTHPDDDLPSDGQEAMAAIESLSEISGLDGEVRPEEKLPLLDERDMQIQRFLGNIYVPPKSKTY